MLFNPGTIVRVMYPEKKYTAFTGQRLLGSGVLEDLLPKIKAKIDRDRGTMFLIFDDETGKQVDFDLRGTLDQVLARALPPVPQSGPGRPRLGVIAREITLLPRQWEWLELQPNGASATIRRLIDEARKSEPAKARKEQAIHASGRFLSAMAGNYYGYEEVSRALYGHDSKRFSELVSEWPKDVRDYALRLAKGGF
jgi:uncharacterized protein